MPNYDYVCSNCGHRMEVSHSIHGHGPSTCPECGGAMKKAFSPPAVHYKGTGWARKESANHMRPSKSKESEHSSESGSGSGSGSGSESKPTESTSTHSADSGSAKTGSSAS